MARAHPDRASAPRQLTLDDWAAEVKSKGSPERDTRAEAAVDAEARHRAVAPELLETPGALLTRTHLRELGLERRAIDAVFRKLPVVALPGYSRPMISAEKYLELIDEHTYHDDRVRPLGASARG